GVLEVEHHRRHTLGRTFRDGRDEIAARRGYVERGAESGRQAVAIVAVPERLGTVQEHLLRRRAVEMPNVLHGAHFGNRGPPHAFSVRPLIRSTTPAMKVDTASKSLT